VNVTVIVCTFNRSELLAKALASVASSILPDSVEWEVLVVDNNSRDRTREVVDQICHQHPGRFRYIFEARPGKSVALNTGILESRGDVLAFMDDDVTVEPTWLRNLTASLDSGEWAGAGGRILPAAAFSPPRWLWLKEPFNFGGALFAHFDLGDEPGTLDRAPYGANMAFQRRMFEKHGGFRTDLGPRPGSSIRNEDTEFGRRLLKAGERLRYEPAAVVYHPVPMERIQKKYFLDWWFDYGRAEICEVGRKPDVWEIERRYLSIPKLCVVGLSMNAVRWALSFDAQTRFFWKTRTWTAAGEIVEINRQWRRGKQAYEQPQKIRSDAAGLRGRMNEPLVSVVMVVCNVDRFLDQAIESILQQTFREFEFIIVDYGSTDKTKEIVTRYADRDPRVRMHEISHCGLGEARNAACSLARGRYIALMDADDVSLPDRLQLQVAYMEHHPNVGLLGAAVQWIDATGRELVIYRFPSDEKRLKEALGIRCSFWQPTVLLRKEAFIRTGGYRDAFAPAEDYDLWLRVTEHFGCANLDDVLLKYRIHPYQVSMRKRKQQTLGILGAKRSAAMRQMGEEDIFRRVDVITPELLTQLGVNEAAQEHELMTDARRWIRYMTWAGEVSTALESAVELLRVKWTHVEGWELADLHLLVAGLRWRRLEFAQSITSALRAVRIQPRLLGRPIKPWLRHIGLVHATE
jgi:glycosyltransferase involved in cell wall biosynthesis